MSTRKRSGSSTKPLNEAVEELVQSLGIGQKLRSYEAVIRWEEIVGEQIARVSTPASIEKGVLVVRVSNGPWRTELNMRKASIVEKINVTLGQNIVRDIRFV